MLAPPLHSTGHISVVVVVWRWKALGHDYWAEGGEPSQPLHGSRGFPSSYQFARSSVLAFFFFLTWTDGLLRIDNSATTNLEADVPAFY